jgi:ubiquinone/menaquinone biosynthesis C-methylase UbiE
MKQPSFPEMYEQLLVGPLFRPWAEIALEDVRLSPGDRLLDIACGTGIVARVARERLGDARQVVGVDVSADMLAVARAVAPDIDWRQGSAADLPLREDEQFDVVVCQQGLQFFPDKHAAAVEMRRALKTAGRLAVLTWRPDSEVPFMRELRQTAERHLGAITDQRHSFGDGAALEALFRGTGFLDARSRTISRTIRFDDGAPFLRMNSMALVGMSAGGKTLADTDRKRALDAILSDSAPVIQRYSKGPELAFELSTNLLTATAR